MNGHGTHVHRQRGRASVMETVGADASGPRPPPDTAGDAPNISIMISVQTLLREITRAGGERDFPQPIFSPLASALQTPRYDLPGSHPEIRKLMSLEATGHSSFQAKSEVRFGDQHGTELTSRALVLGCSGQLSRPISWPGSLTFPGRPGLSARPEPPLHALQLSSAGLSSWACAF